MANQDFNTVFDVSAFIWDEDNMPNNYGFLSTFIELLHRIEKSRVCILMRNELFDEIVNSFPYSEFPSDLQVFGRQAYTFLGNIGSDIVTYEAISLPRIKSCPDQVKSYFSDNLKNEVNYLMSEMHAKNSSSNTYFTFTSLFGDSESLTTEVESDLHTHKTVVADKGTSLEDFFSSFEMSFEHHAKHDKSIHRTRDAWEASDNKDGFVSQLSCYCGNAHKPQKLLDLRYKKPDSNSFYYSYDADNNVYVVFRKTINNIYHAYDEYNIEKVPHEVKKSFGIWKY